MDDKVMCICGNIFEPNQVWNNFFEKGIVLKCPLCSDYENDFLIGKIAYHIKNQLLWDTFVKKYKSKITWRSESILENNDYNQFMREGHSDCVFLDLSNSKKMLLVRSPEDWWIGEGIEIAEFEG